MYKRQIYHIAESNRKNRFGSENRIESNRNFFCPNWNALVKSTTVINSVDAREITATVHLRPNDLRRSWSSDSFQGDRCVSADICSVSVDWIYHRHRQPAHRSIPSPEQAMWLLLARSARLCSAGGGRGRAVI